MVVAGAAQIRVVVRQQGQVLLGQWQVFQALAQDRFEALVATGAEAEGSPAGGFQTRFAMGFTEAQDAQAGGGNSWRSNSTSDNAQGQLKPLAAKRLR
ncbi:hypothetical protein FQZ97_905600 [compost metagenome]